MSPFERFFDVVFPVLVLAYLALVVGLEVWSFFA